VTPTQTFDVDDDAWLETARGREVIRLKARLGAMSFYAARAKAGGEAYWRSLVSSYQPLRPVAPAEMVQAWEDRLAEWGAPALSPLQVAALEVHAHDPSFVPTPKLTREQRMAMQEHLMREPKRARFANAYQAQLQRNGI
jgi:hypothetical protein